MIVGSSGGEELEGLPGEGALVSGAVQGAFWDLISFRNNATRLSLSSPLYEWGD